MVAFNVNVRLVENRVKSHDGSVNVVKVTIQYRIFGITLTLDTTRRIKRPSHEDGWDDEAISVANFAVVVPGSSEMLDATPLEGVAVRVADRASKDDIFSVELETWVVGSSRTDRLLSVSLCGKAKSLPSPQLLVIAVTEASEVFQ